VTLENDAQRAVLCALGMQRAMAGVNEQNRKQGWPMLEMGIALHTGDVVTLAADWATVYRGVVSELADVMAAPRRPIFNSPLHQRLRNVLDRIAPLNLIDRSSPDFSPEGCRTFQDVIRFTHEMAVREMFGLSGDGRQGSSVKLRSPLPLNFWLVDLGGGLREGLTTCDDVTPEMIESVPMKALWRGFAHPGVSWEGTMNISRSRLSGLLAVSATSELGEVSGGDSYGLLSHDYANLSIRFAYHFATIDTLCGENSSQNYISLQFSGGAGSYLGRSLRIELLGRILEEIGFSVSLKGDLIDARLARYDRRLTEEKLDLLGRLLASSRLMDMRLTSEEEVRKWAEAFFEGNYDFLTRRREDEIRGFHTQGGPWRRVEEEGRELCLEDGSRWGRKIASGVSGLVGRVVGTAYHEFLDSLQAYYYFPLAIVKDRNLTEGSVSVRIKPVSGNIDRAGGIVFAMKSVNDYFVFRTNALEGNAMLFQFVNGKRLQRATISRPIKSGVWHELKIEVRGSMVRGFLDGESVIEYAGEEPLAGSFGLWTKADSVTYFDGLTVETGGQREVIPF
jgi:pyruvate,water dikinase